MFKSLLLTVFGVLLYSQQGWSNNLFPKELPQIESLNFEFYLYDELKGEDIEKIIYVLEDARGRLLIKYGLDSTPRVKVHIWGKWASWAKNNKIFLSRNPGGVGVIGFNSFNMLKVDSSEYTSSLTDAESDFRAMMHEPTTLAVYEYVHVLMSFLNKYYYDTPSWLYQGVACYESNAEFDIRRFSEELDYFKQPFSEMDKGANAYILGYSIIEYILDNWGQDSLNKLIQHNGDTKSILNISQENFENGFWEFLQHKYFTPDANKALHDD